MPLFVVKGRPIEFGLASLLYNKAVYRRVCDEIRRNGGAVTHSRRRCFDNQVLQLDDREVRSVASRGIGMSTPAARQVRGPDSFHYSYVERCVASGYVLDPKPFRIQCHSVFASDASILKVVLGDWTWARLLDPEPRKHAPPATNSGGTQQNQPSIKPVSKQPAEKSALEMTNHHKRGVKHTAVTASTSSTQRISNRSVCSSLINQHGRQQKRFPELQLEFLPGPSAVTSLGLTRTPSSSSGESLKYEIRSKKRRDNIGLMSYSASDSKTKCKPVRPLIRSNTESSISTQSINRKAEFSLEMYSSSSKRGRHCSSVANVGFCGGNLDNKTLLPVKGSHDNKILLPVSGSHDKTLLPVSGSHDNNTLLPVNGSHGNNALLPVSGSHDNNALLPVDANVDKMIVFPSTDRDKIYMSKYMTVNNANHNKTLSPTNDSQIIDPRRNILSVDDNRTHVESSFGSCLPGKLPTVLSYSPVSSTGVIQYSVGCSEANVKAMYRGAIDTPDDILEQSIMDKPDLEFKQCSNSCGFDSSKKCEISTVDHVHSQCDSADDAMDTCTDTMASNSSPDIFDSSIATSPISCNYPTPVSGSPHSFSFDICKTRIDCVSSISNESPRTLFESVPLNSCELSDPSTYVSGSHMNRDPSLSDSFSATFCSPDRPDITTAKLQPTPESMTKLTDLQTITLINTIACSHEEGCLPTFPITTLSFWHSMHPLLPNSLRHHPAKSLHEHFMKRVLPQLVHLQQYLDDYVVQQIMKLLPAHIAHSVHTQLSSKQKFPASIHGSCDEAQLERVISSFVGPPL